MKASILEVRDISFSIAGKLVLDGVSFAAKEGELISIIGPNGAGKSTLMRIIDGLLQPTTGDVLVSDHSVRSLSRRALARRVSYVPQLQSLEHDYTVREFVQMGRYAHLDRWGTSREADHEAVRESLELTDATQYSDRLLSTLSGGERQRALIAAALAQGGEILLLDEPTTFLDYRHQVQIIDLLRHLHKATGLTILTVTHNLNLTLAAADSILALREGKVVVQGPPSQILDQEVLKSIYDTRFELIQRPDSDL
ncbi:MAG: ABC transporter ATP-binding protein, partial [bacterium]|nr:ABC transporter ATP-binding protein [bacterium]